MAPPANHGNQNSLIPKINFIMDLISVKVIFLLHFVSVILALTCLNWMPAIYLYYNTFFFGILFWSMHTKERNPEPILLAAVINVVSIALDIICICSTYSGYYNGVYISRFNGYPFSLAFLILNLVLRPFTTFIMARLYFSKNRSVFSTSPNYGGEHIVNNGSSLTSAIRKILFLSPGENGEFQSQNVNANGTYRTNLNVEQKNTAPLTAVLSVPNQQQQTQSHFQPQSQPHPQAKPQQIQPEPQTNAQVEPQSQPQIQSNPETSEQQQQSQQPPQPQPRQSQVYTDPNTGETYQERMI